MIGLGLVCYSISSKVILLAAIWRNTQAGQPHPADSGLHGPGLSVSLRLSV